jgi:protein tyrosine/serine phosphatase
MGTRFSRLGVTMLGTALLSSCAYLTPQNKGMVAMDVIRSRQPSAATIESYVEEHGLRSIINLRQTSDEPWYRQEREVARRHDLLLHDISLSNRRFPSRTTLLQLLETLAYAPHPLLIHCKAGADRTAFAVVLYRHHVLGEPLDEARTSFSLSHGHITYGRFDFLIDSYATSGAEDFQTWVRDCYDPLVFEREWRER